MVNSDNWPYFVLAVKLARPMLLGGERNMTCVGRTLVDRRTVHSVGDERPSLVSPFLFFQPTVPPRAHRTGSTRTAAAYEKLAITLLWT